MFISKAEKLKIYQMIAELKLQIRDLEKKLEEKPSEKKTLSPTDAYRREYARKYYWKKKAERLAAAKPAKVIDLSAPTTITVTPHGKKGSK